MVFAGKNRALDQPVEIRAGRKHFVEAVEVRFDLGVDNVFDRLYFHPLGGAYVGQGTTMPPLHANSPYGISVPGMGRSVYAGMYIKF